MFQIGEYVVHGNDGICEVKDITQLELPGGSSKRQYYLLVPQKEKNGRIYSPVESSKVQTRKVITKQEADTLIREIPAIQAAWVENEKLRENVYKEAIKSCDLRELVKIIKNMYLRRQERISSGKKATVLDDRYFKLAEDKLYSELVFATGKDRNQIEKQIKKVFHFSSSGFVALGTIKVVRLVQLSNIPLPLVVISSGVLPKYVTVVKDDALSNALLPIDFNEEGIVNSFND